MAQDNPVQGTCGDGGLLPQAGQAPETGVGGAARDMEHVHQGWGRLATGGCACIRRRGGGAGALSVVLIGAGRCGPV